MMLGPVRAMPEWLQPVRVLQLLREQSQSPLAHWDGDLQAALSQAQSTVPASQQSLQLLQQLVAQGVQQARRQQ